jgi:toxin ParE1/3/4
MANLLPKAEVDLLEIWDFIFEGAGMERADTFIDRILATCEQLSTFPEMGRSRDTLNPGLRSITEGSYLIFYRIVSKDVEIIRVISGARDLEALLNDDPDLFR